tara:strand:- start:164 stop:1228 length:1065 start_codon:yes stop_codon:yes gene_type:complete
MKTSHNFFSNLAFNLAEIHLGKTNTNPSVGCVVVKNDSVISSGVTSISGRPHAEFNALNKNINFKNSEIYLTLEPCTHFGKTPPCIDLIKRKNIKKVYYCYDDPDLRTFKKAKKILKKKITKLKISSKNSDFYKGYYLSKKKNIPLIDAKIAISKDFYTISRKSKWITNYMSRKVGHLLRSKYNCIISTSKTVNKDNSLLNCRINGLNNYKPDLIIIDRKLKLKKKLALFNITKKRNTYIVTSSTNDQKISYFKKKKIKIIRIKKLNSKNDFKKLFKKIFLIGKRRILIETGLVFLNKLIKFNLIDDLYVFEAGKSLRKYGFNKIKLNNLKNYASKNQLKVNLKEDKLFKIKVK